MTKDKTVSKIIEIKEFTKEQMEAAVKKARERLDAEQAVLDALNHEYRCLSEDLARRQLRGTIPVNEVELYDTYLKHLGKKIEHQKKTVASRAAEADEAQKAMIEAYKEQRLFEILHEKIRQVHVKEADQLEQKEADFSFLSRKAGA